MNSPRRIFLDHAATTPLCPAASEAMIPWLESEFGNASSLHAEGRRAKLAIDEAREIVSEEIGCEFGELIFTGSGTEAANMAILGTAFAHAGDRRNRIFLSSVEHHCVLETEESLRTLGFSVEQIPVDRYARVDVNWLEDHLDDDVLLVSVMHANNETGAIQPIQEISQAARKHGALYHADCVQSFGNLTVRSDSIDADFLTISAHKIGGPKGIGAIYIRAGNKPKPIVMGGGQEREMRAGTENVAGIVGFGAAVRAFQGDPQRGDRKKSARDRFRSLLGNGADVEFLSPEQGVLSGHCLVRFPGANSDSMLIRLDQSGVAASSGSACSSGSSMPSHVLAACGHPLDQARQAIRFTFGWTSTIADAEEGAERVLACAQSIWAKATARS